MLNGISSGQITGHGASRTVVQRVAGPPAAESTNFTRSESLVRSLAESPDIRPDKLEGARAKVSDLQYPPLELVDRISSLLAMRIRA